MKSESEVAQSCPTLSDPMDCSLPGFSVLGIFQAGVLEWGAIAFSEPSKSKTLRVRPLFFFVFFFSQVLQVVLMHSQVYETEKATISNSRNPDFKTVIFWDTGQSN